MPRVIYWEIRKKVVKVLDKANEPDILGLKIDYYGREIFCALF